MRKNSAGTLDTANGVLHNGEVESLGYTLHMKHPAPTFRSLVFLCVFAVAVQAEAAVFQLTASLDYSGSWNTIDFDGHPDFTVADQLYQNQGITFWRDDGRSIFLWDVASHGWDTTSDRFALATVANQSTDWRYVTHLNLQSAIPLFAIGAFFGNDQTLWGNTDFTTLRMSAYDSAHQYLGSTEVTANQNTDVDQFIGIASDTPFTTVRFENLSSSGMPTVAYSVVIDDLIYAPVPEPMSGLLMACGLVTLLVIRGHRSSVAIQRRGR